MARYESYFDSSCTELGPNCPIEGSVYGYRPSLGLNVACVTTFSFLAVAHACIGIWKKTHFFTYLVILGCVFEVIGYAGRIHLWEFPFSESGFSMDITCLIFAPMFFTAAMHLTLKHITLAFGATTSILSPTTYTWIFATIDTTCLVLHITGGALVGAARNYQTQRSLGTDMMLVGIAVQILTVVSFLALMADYLIRTRRSWHNVPFAATRLLDSSRFKVFVGAMVIAYIAISTRCVYRLAQLSGGFPNKLTRSEVSFALLESLMMAIAAMAFIAFHPGLVFPEPSSPRPRSRLRSWLSFSEPARSASHGELEMICQGVENQPELLKETFENGVDTAKKSRSRANTGASIASAKSATRQSSRETWYPELKAKRSRANTEASIGTSSVKSTTRQASRETWYSEATVVEPYDLDTRVLSGEQVAMARSWPERIDSSHASHEIGSAQ